ncbi:glycosyltransferase [Evansella clarkii]|uniref:glycosyltransferase n=1 Tax=Evansella clarkii TaxID=79879 RepID=UPI000997980B|nr:glycosyltransferase [Evansella clarkii]
MNDTKKVVHITTVHHPLDPRIYYKQCHSLQKAGYDVTLIAPSSSDLKGENTVPVIPLKKYKNRFISMLLSPIEAYKKAKELKADYYHFHDPEFLPAAWLLKKKHNTVFYDIHEDYETGIVTRDYLTKPLRIVISKIYKLIEKVFSKNMELVLAEKYYKEKYPRGNCVLNYPILNENLINKRRDTSKVENKLLYTGNVTTDRGALTHAALPNIDENMSVYFYGRCPEWLAEQMLEVAGENKEQLYIEGINRYVPKEEIDHSYISKQWLAGLALFPPSEHYKKKELTKFFEYMTAGIPIICSNFKVWKDFIDKYRCGIAVDPYNEEEIRQAINYLRSNPAEAKKMGENGRKAVLKELNWGKEEEELISLYQRMQADSTPK